LVVKSSNFFQKSSILVNDRTLSSEWKSGPEIFNFDFFQTMEGIAARALLPVD